MVKLIMALTLTPLVAIVEFACCFSVIRFTWFVTRSTIAAIIGRKMLSASALKGKFKDKGSRSHPLTIPYSSSSRLCCSRYHLPAQPWES